MTAHLHNNIRYYFPALAEGLRNYFSKSIRIAVGFREDTADAQAFIYDPHGLVEDRYRSDLKSGSLPSQSLAGCQPWNPRGKVLAVRPANMPQGLADVVVLLEIPHWSVNDDPMIGWAERFADYIGRNATRVDSYNTLLHFAPHAVQNATRKVFYGGVGSQVSGRGLLHVIAPYLSRLCEVAGRREEGHLPSGEMIAGDYQQLVNCNARQLVPTIPLENAKHLRKALQMAPSGVLAACADEEMLGFLDPANLPPRYVRVSLNGTGVAAINAKGTNDATQTKIGFYRKGRFSGVPLNPDTNVIAEDLQFYGQQIGIALAPAVASGIANLACEATSEGHGAMLVVGDDYQRLAGQGQGVDPPLDVTSQSDLDQLVAMSTVDGAVFIRPDGEVPCAAVLVDGNATPNYDPSRGARHNSAIRYTASDPNAIILAISEDGPYSIFVDGQDVSAAPQLSHPVSTRSNNPQLPNITEYWSDIQNNRVTGQSW